MRYALTIQYDGRFFSGSQLQDIKSTDKNNKSVRTVQEELEKALCTLIKPKIKTKRPIKTVFSGRTDKGVSAEGQVVHFDCEEVLVASKFLRSINGILPPDISVSDIKSVAEMFHAQKSAKLRHYRYKFINREIKNVFDKDLLRVSYSIDIQRMQTSLNYLLGEHDFSAFKSSGTLNPSKICFIHKATCKKVGDEVVIDIVGNRFLYNMVRTIVGTLLEIEGHNLSPEHMKNVLESKDRTKAGMTVSPLGLTLMKVEY